MNLLPSPKFIQLSSCIFICRHSSSSPEKPFVFFKWPISLFRTRWISQRTFFIGEFGKACKYFWQKWREAKGKASGREAETRSSATSTWRAQVSTGRPLRRLTFWNDFAIRLWCNTKIPIRFQSINTFSTFEMPPQLDKVTNRTRVGSGRRHV